MKVQQEANHLQLQLCDIARMMYSFSVAPFIQTAIVGAHKTLRHKIQAGF